MAIVARGLGLPEDGAIVAGGFGTVEVDPNAMSATLTGSGTILATLSVADTGPVYTLAGGARRQRFIPTRGEMAATLTAAITLTGDLDFTVNFDAELEQLLLVGAL